MLAIDQNLFNQNLLLTQAYCDLQLKNTYKNYASILRSFNPLYDGKLLFEFKLGFYRDDSKEGNWAWTKWSKDPWGNNLYDELFENQLKYKRENIGEILATEYSGKILIAEIEITTVDGASEAESGGLIDGYDCPPIDTWFYMTKNKNGRVLFAWIPDPFEDLVNAGIAVNVHDLLYWYKEKGTESNNWHEENLGAAPKNVIAESKSPDSFFEQIKKLFS